MYIFYLVFHSLPRFPLVKYLYVYMYPKTQRFNVHENPFHYTHYRPLYLDTFFTVLLAKLKSQNVAIEKPIFRLRLNK